MRDVVLTALLVVGLASSACADEEEITIALVEAMVEIEFEEITLDGCHISYQRTFSRPHPTHGFSSFRRFVDLETLGEASTSVILMRMAGDTPNYLLEIPYDDQYRQRRLDVWRFSRWVEENYPGSNWPYTHPDFYDDFTATLEVQLQEKFVGVEDYNRRIDYSDIGTVTVFEWGFSISALDEAALLRFRDALLAYSSSSGCDIDH